MEAIIIWGVIWFFSISIGSWLVFLISAALVEKAIASEWAPFVVGGILAGTWGVFSIVQVVIHIIHLLQYLGAL